MSPLSTLCPPLSKLCPPLSILSPSLSTLCSPSLHLLSPFFPLCPPLPNLCTPPSISTSTSRPHFPTHFSSIIYLLLPSFVPPSVLSPASIVLHFPCPCFPSPALSSHWSNFPFPWEDDTTSSHVKSLSAVDDCRRMIYITNVVRAATTCPCRWGQPCHIIIEFQQICYHYGPAFICLSTLSVTSDLPAAPI